MPLLLLFSVVFFFLFQLLNMYHQQCRPTNCKKVTFRFLALVIRDLQIRLRVRYFLVRLPNDFRTSNQLRDQDCRSSLLLTSRKGGFVNKIGLTHSYRKQGPWYNGWYNLLAARQSGFPRDISTLVPATSPPLSFMQKNWDAWICNGEKLPSDLHQGTWEPAEPLLVFCW